MPNIDTLIPFIKDTCAISFSHYVWQVGESNSLIERKGLVENVQFLDHSKSQINSNSGGLRMPSTPTHHKDARLQNDKSLLRLFCRKTHTTKSYTVTAC